MNKVIGVGDEVFVRNDGRRAIITGVLPLRNMYIVDDILMFRHEFIPVKWNDDGVGNTGIGVCAKNGSEG